MAKPVTARYGQLYVKLSNGATPAVFAAPCGFTSKAFNRSKTLGGEAIPDCDDPDAPAWEVRDVQSMSATISGDGLLAKAALAAWEAALASVESIECQVEIAWADGDKQIYQGRFHLESFEITATMGEKIKVSVSMQSDGEITATLVPAGG